MPEHEHTRMRAIVFHEHGGPEVLRYEPEWPAPQPGPGEVLVRVKACALNHLDIFVRRGMPGIHTALPHISGGDVAGIVAALGPGVRGVEVGQRVLVDPMVPEGAIGENTQGGLAEYLKAPAANMIPLPEGVTFEQAAALPIAYGTAWRMLVARGRIQVGEHVAILGASGGVGTGCVQIARLAGCVVYAIAGSDEKLERLRDLGADHLINSSREDFGRALWRLTGKQGVDVMVDYSGQSTWPASVRATKLGGRILTCGATSGHDAQTDLRYVWVREQTIIGANGWRREDLLALLDLVAQGKIVPVIDRIWPLERTREAEEAIERREIFGKVILTP